MEKNDIHLILMDIMMPQLDGIAATAKLREKSTGSPWWWIPYTVVGITLPLGFCLLYDRLIRSVRW